MTLLERLSRAWANRYPRRAVGGSWALSGFAYQFHISLVEILTAFLEASDKDVAVAAEMLSDLAMSVDEKIQVVQVKRRLSRSSLRNALEEYRTILETVREEFSEAMPTLRFVIATEDIGVGIEEERDAWLDELGVSAEERAEILGSIELRAEESPLKSVVSVLHNEFGASDVVRLVERWVGELTIDAKAAPLRIWSDLVELRGASRAQRAPGVILTSIDRPPERTGRGYVLTGQQPRLQHLREGAFAPRRGLIANLADQLVEWAADDHEQRPVTSLRVFWIAGRSGSGKSIAMLQTAAEVRGRWPGPVVWLGEAVNRLPDAVAWASFLQGATGERVLLVADDPYVATDAAAMWKAATDRMLPAIETGDTAAIPVVLACGPAEQARRLKEDLLSLVSVDEVSLPNAGAGDWDELRHFFRERTNEEPPPVDSPNTLLVQAFFEWREGQPLLEFARGFHARIRRFDESGAVMRYASLLLAANRMYVGLPIAGTAELLNPAEHDALNQLLREHHLVDLDEDADRPGRWLAHPHLSTAI